MSAGARQMLAVLFPGLFLAIAWQGQWQLQSQDPSAASLAGAMGSVSALRWACYAGLLALAFLLNLGQDAPWKPRGTAETLMLTGLGWAALSLLWSADPGFGALRLAAMLAYVGCAWGLSRRLSVGQLRLLLRDGCGWLVVLACLLALGLATQLPQRLGGPFHPNTLGALAATWWLSLLPDLDKGWPARLAAAVALLAILLSGSRTCLLAVLVATLLGGKTRASRRLAPPLMLGLVAVMALRGGPPGELNGRLRIWGLVLDHMPGHWWLGYGYEGFWLPQRIRSLSEALGWGVSSCHSAPLEVLASLGVVGLALWLGFLFLAGARAVEDRYALSLLAAAAIISLLESTYVKPYSFYGLGTLATLLAASRPGEPVEMS